MLSGLRWMLVSDPHSASASGAPSSRVSGAWRERRGVPGRRRLLAPVKSTQPTLLLALMVACVAFACASPRSAGLSRRNPNVISRDEIERGQLEGVHDLYELIDRDRPRWLQMRSARSLGLPTVIAVYHNQMMLGGVEMLRGFQLLSVTSIRYLDAAQAMLLPGAGSAHIEGAIVISTAVVRDTGSVRLPSRLIRGGT